MATTHSTTPNFDHFLNTSLPDEQTQRFVWQWLGYLLSERTDMQKILLITGAFQSGKSLFVRIIQGLVGKGNYTVMWTSFIHKESEKANTLGRSVINFNLYLDGEGLPKSATQFIKDVSGEKTMMLKPKGFTEPSGFKHTGRIHIMTGDGTNRIPPFEGSDGTIEKRIMHLKFRNQIPSKQQDSRLYEKIEEEFPAIAMRALQGLCELNTQGHFTAPAA